MKKILFFVFIFFIHSLAFAGTYYVHPSGSASWSSCTNISTPCSLSTANSNVGADDIVYMRGGTYSTGIAPSNDGTDGHRITFKAYTGETPHILLVSTGIALNGRSYIVIDGITVTGSGGYGFQIEQSGHHNEIKNCTIQDGAGGMIRATCGATNPETGYDYYTCNPTHNWIHHNQFLSVAGGSACTNEGGDGLRLGQPWYGDGGNNYNTIEDNDFIGGGHATMDSYGFHYAVIRNNRFRNEPWYSNGSSVCRFGSDYTDNAYDGLWSHRNVQVGFTPDKTDSLSLVEGNRFIYTGISPNSNTDANLVLAGRGMVARYNQVIGAVRMGIYFKYGWSDQNGYGGTNCRVYNNTVYHTGWGYEGGSDDTSNETRRNAITFDISLSQHTENVVKNNIFYLSRDGDLGGAPGSHGGYESFTVGITTENNWCSTSATGCSGYGDPSFVSAPTDLYQWSTYASLYKTTPNLALNASSGIKDQGTHLTRADGARTSSTFLKVDDAMYFQDGSWGSALAKASAGLGGTFTADCVAVGTVSNYACISRVDYENKTLVLSTALTWADNDPVWLYSNSSGERVLYGTAPEIGAYEIPESTSDTTAPVVSGVYPTANQNCTPHRNSITWGFTTVDDNSVTCRYSLTDVAYNSMSLEMAGKGTTSHSVTITPQCDYTYTYYYSCRDSVGNTSTTTSHSFYVTPQHWKRGHRITIQ